MPTVRLMKIGADPEFSFLDREGRMVEANAAISRVRSKFGLDGCSSIAELRPSPSINPSQVVRNIYGDLLAGYYANPRTRELYWKAGSSVGDGQEEDVFATGGHIHFGIHAATSYRIYGNRSDYYRNASEYLDTYLAQVVRLLEDPSELRERLDGEYGFLGDHRSNTHGMEYRVLGSWLTSPRVAEGVLCLAQTILYQHMWLTAHKKVIVLDRLAPRSETNEYDDYAGDPNVTRALKTYRTKFKQIQSDIRKFKLYRQHELPIEFIFKLIEAKKTWYPGKDVDMKQAWGISSAASLGEQLPPLSKKILPIVKFDDIWKRARR